MIHPLHSCKGKGVYVDKRERKEVVNGFWLSVHDACRCADKKQSRSARHKTVTSSTKPFWALCLIRLYAQ